jgi:PilZ domain
MVASGRATCPAATAGSAGAGGEAAEYLGVSTLREGMQVSLIPSGAAGEEMSARVVRVAGDVVSLAFPHGTAGVPPAIVSTVPVELTWSGRRSQGSVHGVIERVGATIDVRVYGERRAGQRRSYIRMPVLLDLEVTTRFGTVLRGVGVDVSAAGIRARIPTPVAIGDTVQLAIRVPGEDTIDVIARVVRRHAGSILGLEFVDPPSAVREALIRFVITCQRRALALGRSGAGAAPADPLRDRVAALSRVGDEVGGSR